MSLIILYVTFSIFHFYVVKGWLDRRWQPALGFWNDAKHVEDSEIRDTPDVSLRLVERIVDLSRSLSNRLDQTIFLFLCLRVLFLSFFTTSFISRERKKEEPSTTILKVWFYFNLSSFFLYEAYKWTLINSRGWIRVVRSLLPHVEIVNRRS